MNLQQPRHAVRWAKRAKNVRTVPRSVVLSPIWPLVVLGAEFKRSQLDQARGAPHVQLRRGAHTTVF